MPKSQRGVANVRDAHAYTEKGVDDNEIVGLFSPQRRLFRKSKGRPVSRKGKLQIDVHFARIRDDAHALIIGYLKAPWSLESRLVS